MTAALNRHCSYNSFQVAGTLLQTVQREHYRRVIHKMDPRCPTKKCKANIFNSKQWILFLKFCNILYKHNDLIFYST